MEGIARLSVSGLPLLDGVPRQGLFLVGERGHRLTERRPPFLGEGRALPVKDANPRISHRQTASNDPISQVWIANLIETDAEIMQRIEAIGPMSGAAMSRMLFGPRGAAMASMNKSLAQMNKSPSRVKRG